MPVDSAHEFVLTFNQVDDFDQAFARRGSETGFFFHSSRQVTVGEAVTIRVSIRGLSSPVLLEGRIAWRRVRDGGPEMPAGVFVALSERDRARLNGLLRYLRDGAGPQDRRVHPRYPISVSGAYRTAQGDYPCETRDLSQGGAFLRCTGPLLTIGSRLPVVLFFDGPESDGTELVARVAWIDLFDETKGMGISFSEGQPTLRRVVRTIRNHEKDRSRLSSL